MNGYVIKKGKLYWDAYAQKWGPLNRAILSNSLIGAREVIENQDTLRETALADMKVVKIRVHILRGKIFTASYH